jgi:molybdopterin molybdotransferase/putative molybdopterin biosynthesis protein
MDGVAIRADEAGCAATAAAETGEWQLPASSFAWVDTGQPMPRGTDTVVERERVVAAADGGIRITGPAPFGLHVRAPGEDFQAGQVLVPPGRRLGPAHLAAAAATGHATLVVTRRPVVAIIPTGNEIKPVGSRLGPDGVVDSNSVMLAARTSQAGARPVVSDVQPDDAAAIEAELRRAAVAADLVLILAGSSAGRGDHTAAVIAQAGRLTVRGAAVRPGHPVLLGHVLAAEPGSERIGQSLTVRRPAMSVPVIGVPGYPMAAAVIFELFAIPLLATLQGARPSGHTAQQVQLACDWTSKPEVEDWVPVSLSSASADPDASGPVMATPGGRGAGAISRMTSADAWWPIPIGHGKFARGDLIEVQRVPALL